MNYQRNVLKTGMTAFLVLFLVFGFSVLAGAEDEHYGGWLDEIVVIEEASEAAGVSLLEQGEIDVYADTITNPELFQRVLDSDDLTYDQAFGSYSELTFNPAGPVFEGTGELNPFAVPRVREAMNYLVDREYIADEIYGGMAVPRFFPLATALPDYSRMITKARELESKYAHNPELAEEIIEEEMIELGAEKVDGQWHYDGDLVELSILIRVEDERNEVGDYVASLLEDIGFAVQRNYATASEASPIWLMSDPAEGGFHIYTGGWILTVVERDEGISWAQMFTDIIMPQPLFQAYDPVEELYTLADRIYSRDFDTVAEREEMMERALELGMEDSVRIYLIDQQAFAPYRSDVQITSDLAGGIAGSYLWPYTARFRDQVGGQMQIALPSIITDAWNPIGGSNWIFDMMLIRATGELGYIPDPYTGLHYPRRYEKAEVSIREGLPVDSTLDWVELEFVEENVVPEEAWVDWDAEAQEFITVGEKHPDGLTSRRKARVYYPDDALENVIWHDGSNFSVADAVMSLILSFDRAQEESDYFDESAIPAYQTFTGHFRGVEIVSTDPIIIDYYTDQYYMDAEQYIPGLFPYYQQGPGAWHNMALGLMAEADEQLAFTMDKADNLDIEHMNMIGGPSLEVLDEKLQEAQETNFIPFESTLGEFIDEEEAAARYSNLENWYNERGHFWVGTGPYYLHDAHHVEGIAELRRYDDHPDPASKYEIFAEPMIPEISLTGDGVIRIGSDLVYDVSITFEGEPYPAEMIDEVKYLIFDAQDNLVATGEAEHVGEADFEVHIGEEITSQLIPGRSRIEIIVTSFSVSLPTIEELGLVTFE